MGDDSALSIVGISCCRLLIIATHARIIVVDQVGTRHRYGLLPGGKATAGAGPAAAVFTFAVTTPTATAIIAGERPEQEQTPKPHRGPMPAELCGWVMHADQEPL